LFEFCRSDRGLEEVGQLVVVRDIGKEGLAEVLGLFFLWAQVARNEVSVADVGQWGFFLSADVSYV